MNRPTRTIEIELSGGITRPFTIYDNPLSLQVTSECLSGMAYPTPPQLRTEDVKTIVDVGANIGAASIWFHSRFPNAIIHAYEPCEQSFHLLGENTLNCKVRRHNGGLGDTTGNTLLFISKQDAACDSLKQPRDYFPASEFAVNTETVYILRASDALEPLLPIDILKIDTEGSELPILQSIRENNHQLFQKIKVIHAEYHSENDRIKIDEIMQDQGFTLFHASTNYPHRGLLGYLRNDLLTQENQNLAIR